MGSVDQDIIDKMEACIEAAIESFRDHSIEEYPGDEEEIDKRLAIAREVLKLAYHLIYVHGPAAYEGASVAVELLQQAIGPCLHQISMKHCSALFTIIALQQVEDEKRKLH